MKPLSEHWCNRLNATERTEPDGIHAGWCRDFGRVRDALADLLRYVEDAAVERTWKPDKSIGQARRIVVAYPSQVQNAESGRHDG